MNPQKIVFTLFLFLCWSCQKKEVISSAHKDRLLTSYVNPFIGTGGHGHTYPGATMPFGMMQLSPDTRLEGWDGCSGYHYSDDEIYGFTHTHLSGTGVSDYGDILLMPTNKAIFNNGADGTEGYKSKFSHQKEEAKPGYYKVYLEDTDINVELTVSKRSGMHKYDFSSTNQKYIILDLEHRDQLIEHKIHQVSPKIIQGFRHSKAWATHQKLFFYIEFSHEFQIQYPLSKNPTKAAMSIHNPNNDPVFVKIGISAVDINGAKNNLKTEIGDKTFEEVKKEAQYSWEKQLEKIVIESNNTDYKTNFYSSMYHVMIAPNLYQDVDGRYRGMDLKIHQSKEFDYYTVFSLWDTYRAAHPLYTIIEQDKTNDFINTFLAKYDEGGIMPIWDLASNYTGCMIGYHAVSVIADAYLKGIQKYDADKALQAMIYSATRNKLGLKSYKNLGFIPLEEESESVSKTLEYAYDDWTIAQMAKAMNKQNTYQKYIKRAQFYKNVYDPKTQFMRGRFRNTWFAPFDPYEVNFNYTEANAWQYSFYVPQDISGFIELLGGKTVLENNLDKLFTAKNETSGRSQADITGLIGQYAHGNEPSHHMAYLYNFVNKPYKSQDKIHQILTKLYTNAPNGISGNEDCGQMSAWYIFSSLGFYPVTPGSNQYIIGTPLFEKATINLENLNQFTIIANNLSNTNIYIKSAYLNGLKLDRTYITHKEILDGGVLTFEMTDSPSKWGIKNGQEPVTEIKENLIVPAPFIAEGNIAFKGKTTVVLDNIDKDTDIYYSLDTTFNKYNTPFTISKKSTLRVFSQKDSNKSEIITTEFFKIDPSVKIKLETKYANQYNAGGDNALIDGVLGTQDFRTGTWQGYWDEDVIVTVDLGKVKSFSTINVNFLKDQRSWIFLPKEVRILISKDNKNFKTVYYSLNKTIQSEKVEVKKTQTMFKEEKARFVKIVAKKLGELPTWHLGNEHDGRSWIFVDEIQIK
ncbi:GH92 family glycosyl hydrolase [Polaribacter sp.]|uniref:GH92 family glycosyl hydrolase n=1 Tax=Polaribacter sp. TaxID=1920175 RepID=UPI003F69C241